MLRVNTSNLLMAIDFFLEQVLGHVAAVDFVLFFFSEEHLGLLDVVVPTADDDVDSVFIFFSSVLFLVQLTFFLFLFVVVLSLVLFFFLGVRGVLVLDCARDFL